MVQSLVATGGVYKGQGRNQRELMTHTYWNSSFKGNNCNSLSQSRRSFKGLPSPFGQGNLHVDPSIVARVRPRTSKGITDLLLLTFVRLKTACPSKKLCELSDSPAI